MTPLHPVQARQQFLYWLRGAHPQLYGAAMNYALQNRGMTLGDTSSELSNGATVAASNSIWDKVVEGVSKVGTAYLTYKQQQDLLKVQLERAKNGLSPIDTAEYGMGVNVGMSQATRSQITQWLLLAGVGIGAFMLLRKVM